MRPSEEGDTRTTRSRDQEMNPDAIIAPIWLSVNIVLGVAAWRAGRLLFPGECLRQRLLHSVVIAWAAITLVSVALGSVGILGRWSAMTGVAATSIIVIAATRPRRRGDGSGAAGATSASGSSVRVVPCSWDLFVVLLVATLIAHAVVDGLWGTMSDCDSLMYHIPLVDQWIRAGGLYAPDCYHWSNPGGNEVLGFWSSAPFTGDFFSPAVNVPAVVLLALASLEFGGLLGLGVGASRLATIVVLSNDVILRQLTDSSNDVPVASLVIASLCYGFRWAGGRRKADLLLCGTCLGLLAGVKYYALGYVAVSWAVCVAMIMHRSGLRPAVWSALVMIGVALPFGFYWYARNAAVTGTPFYPLGISPTSDVLSRMYPHPWRSSIGGSGRLREVVPLLFRAVWRMAGPVHTAAMLAIPATVAWLAWPRRDPPAVPGRPLAALAVASGLVYAATPFCIEDDPGTLNQLESSYTPARYGLSFLTIAVFCLFVSLQIISNRLSRPGRDPVDASPAGPSGRRGVWIVHGTMVLLALAASAGILVPNPSATFSAGASLFLGVDLVGIAALCALIKGWGPATVAAACMATATGFAADRLSSRWHGGFSERYSLVYQSDSPRFLNEERTPKKVCVLDHQPLAFAGSRRQHRIVQLQHPSAISRAFEEGVDLLVVRTHRHESRSGWDAYADVDRWVVQHGGRLILWRRDPVYTLYRVDAGAGPGRRGGD